jgi:hypothetical protein
MESQTQDSHRPIDELDEAIYAPIALSKFFVLYCLTFGAYSIVWFYRNWRYIRARDDSTISPLWRSIFAPIWYYFLLVDLREETDASLSGWLAAAWFLLAGLGRLPDPYWLLWFLTFLALLPAALAINRANGARDAVLPEYNRWRKRNVPVVLLGAMVQFFTAAIAFQLVPSTMVQTGEEVPGRYVAHLREIDLVGEGDTVLYFYSNAMLSIKRDGTVLTNRGLGSYWIDDVTDERHQYFVTYEEITTVEPDWATSWMGETAVRLTMGEGSWLSFGLSAEAGRDTAFVQELERRRDRQF